MYRTPSDCGGICNVHTVAHKYRVLTQRTLQRTLQTCGSLSLRSRSRALAYLTGMCVARTYVPHTKRLWRYTQCAHSGTQVQSPVAMHTSKRSYVSTHGEHGRTMDARHTHGGARTHLTQRTLQRTLQTCGSLSLRSRSRALAYLANWTIASKVKESHSISGFLSGFLASHAGFISFPL